MSHAALTFAYNSAILSNANDARRSDGRSTYHRNHRLWLIAHAYAKKMAASGSLEHNPQLVNAVSKSCPAWTDIGENIGVDTSASPTDLFQAYMNSAPHKANLLDTAYTEVGIATATVVRDGVTQHWNVIDFGNHCK